MENGGCTLSKKGFSSAVLLQIVPDPSTPRSWSREPPGPAGGTIRHDLARHPPPTRLVPVRGVDRLLGRAARGDALETAPGAPATQGAAPEQRHRERVVRRRGVRGEGRGPGRDAREPECPARHGAA